MFSAILAIMLLPITDLGRSKGLQFRPLSKIAFYIFVANFLVLMSLGAKHVESPFIEFGQISTVLYFAHFIFIVPALSIIENTLMDLSYTPKANNIEEYLYGHFSKPQTFISALPPILNKEDFCAKIDEMLDILIERDLAHKEFMYVFYAKTLTNNKSFLILVDEDVPHFDRSMAGPYPKLAKVFKFSGHSIFHYHQFDPAINTKVQIERLHFTLLKKAMESNDKLSIDKFYSGTNMIMEVRPLGG